MKLSPQFFRRLDESDDTLFYSQPRITKHVDENASQAITEFLRPILPQNELILDLMSSAYSHFPLTIEPKNVVGLGLNQTELEYNSMLGEFYVQNLNHNPVLPFVDQTFSVVVITVSIQYLIQPTLVFQQINRILKHNGLLVIFYSNRMFPTKTVAVWHQTNQDQKQDLIDKYFQVAENELGRFMPAQFLDITPSTQVDTYTDPVYVAMAKKIVH